MHPIQAQRKKHGKRTAAMIHGWCLIFGESVNPGIGQIIPIEPELVIYRDAGVALTLHSLKNPEAKSFVTFLSSPQSHAIFKQFGWNK